MNHKILQKTLIVQHNLMRQDLATITAQTDMKSTNATVIFDALTQLKNHLTRHLALEDGEFYPEVFRIFETRNMDTTSIKQFVKEMEEIGTMVKQFLTAYQTADSIGLDSFGFASVYKPIRDTLSIRMSAEEDGAYMYLVKE